MQPRKKGQLFSQSFFVLGLVILLDGAALFFAGIYAGWGCNYGICLGWSQFLSDVAYTLLFVGIVMVLSARMFLKRQYREAEAPREPVFGKGKNHGIASLAFGTILITTVLLSIWYHRLPLFLELLGLIFIGLLFILMGIAILRGTMRGPSPRSMGL
ncbi:MAG: hypothetical protein ACE5QF_08735 [Thermoplasmata archaeon]